MSYGNDTVGRIEERLCPGLEPVEPLVPECDICEGKCKYGDPYKQLPNRKVVRAAKFYEELAKLRAANDNAPPPPPPPIDPWEPLDRLDDYWRGEEIVGAMPGALTYPGRGYGDLGELVYLALGLAGETGEAVDQIKKMARQHGVFSATRPDPERLAKLFDELGDVLWYWTRIVKIVLDMRGRGENFDDIMRANLRKLRQRNSERAQAAASSER